MADDKLDFVLQCIVIFSFLWVCFGLALSSDEGQLTVSTQSNRLLIFKTGAIALLLAFGIWGVCKTEQRLDYLENKVIQFHGKLLSKNAQPSDDDGKVYYFESETGTVKSAEYKHRILPVVLIGWMVIFMGLEGVA